MGDTVVLDSVATPDGSNSDITRMVHLGEPSAEVRRVYEPCLRRIGAAEKLHGRGHARVMWIARHGP